MTIARAALLALLTSIAACHRAKPATGAAMTERIVHGTVSVQGTAFEQRLVLNSGSGPIRLHASTTDSVALVRVAGLYLSVHGVDEAGALAVKTFTVVSVNGAPVVDGVLRVDGDRVYIDTASGARLLGNPPSALRRMDGTRVWIEGPLDTGPNQYGIIVPR
ncbi:MAG TPA: hypothetical protein VHB25_14015 [Gemmatimonadaceae bacterium]|nr:hypothetical protein [Gemmatimonadaceae bacterium]